MRTLKLIQKEMQEATKNMTAFIKSGNEKSAIMWAEKLEKLEKEAGI